MATNFVFDGEAISATQLRFTLMHTFNLLVYPPQENSEEHKSMAGVIGQSKKLITKYGRRELTDKVLIIFAVGFFFAVVLYILRKRLFPTYGPLELIFYLFSLTKHLFAFLSNLIPSFS